MSKDFTVTIFESSDRAETFFKVFGRHDVYVQSPIPSSVNLPGFDEPQYVYLLDMDLVEAEEMDRLVEVFGDRFHLEADEIRKLITIHSVPILARDCLLVVENPQKWLD